MSAASEGNAFSERRGGLDVAAVSHQGRVRYHNEDTFVCQPARGLFAVIDGMGGAQAGEVAADLTRQALLDAPATEHPRQTIHRVNGRIVEQGRADPQLTGMGCVVTAVRLVGDELQVAHVGDTRAYVASQAGCEQLTRDHTLVAEQQEALGLTDEQARALPNQHRVTRDVGRKHHDSPDWVESATASLQRGDLLLLCSDGLHDLVPHGELSRLLVAARAARDAPLVLVNRLVALALARGGTDNVTVVVVRRTRRQVDRRALLAALLGIGAVTGGFLVGLSWQKEAPRPVGPALVSSLVGLQGDSLLAAGALDLSVELGFSGAVHALGPSTVLGSQHTTRILGGSDIELVAWAPQFPPGPARWDLQVEPGARLVLRQAVLQAPDLDIHVSLEGEGSELALLHCDLVLASFTGEGGSADAPAGLLTLDGGALTLHAQGERALLSTGRVVRLEEPARAESIPPEAQGDP